MDTYFMLMIKWEFFQVVAVLLYAAPLKLLGNVVREKLDGDYTLYDPQGLIYHKTQPKSNI